MEIENCSDEALLEDYQKQLNEAESDRSAVEQDKSNLLMQKTEASNYVMHLEEYKMFTTDSYYNENGNNCFLQQAEGDYYFVAESDKVSENIIIVRDSDKAVVPQCKSTDVSTNITVSSADKSIQLDTKINVEKLTEGEEYKAIMEVLKVDNSESFDIKLFQHQLKIMFQNLRQAILMLKFL